MKREQIYFQGRRMTKKEIEAGREKGRSRRQIIEQTPLHMRLQVGDVVTRIPNVLNEIADGPTRSLMHAPMTGTVIYVNLRGLWHTVEYIIENPWPYGEDYRVRETYWGISR